MPYRLARADPRTGERRRASAEPMRQAPLSSVRGGGSSGVSAGGGHAPRASLRPARARGDDRPRASEAQLTDEARRAQGRQAGRAELQRGLADPTCPGPPLQAHGLAVGGVAGPAALTGRPVRRGVVGAAGAGRPALGWGRLRACPKRAARRRCHPAGSLAHRWAPCAPHPCVAHPAGSIRAPAVWRAGGALRKGHSPRRRAHGQAGGAGRTMGAPCTRPISCPRLRSDPVSPTKETGAGSVRSADSSCRPGPIRCSPGTLTRHRPRRSAQGPHGLAPDPAAALASLTRATAAADEAGVLPGRLLDTMLARRGPQGGGAEGSPDPVVGPSPRSAQLMVRRPRLASGVILSADRSRRRCGLGDRRGDEGAGWRWRPVDTQGGGNARSCPRSPRSCGTRRGSIPDDRHRPCRSTAYQEQRPPRRPAGGVFAPCPSLGMPGDSAMPARRARDIAHLHRGCAFPGGRWEGAPSGSGRSWWMWVRHAGWPRSRSKTAGRPARGQSSSNPYLEITRVQGYNAVLTISNQLTASPSESPVSAEGAA